MTLPRTCGASGELPPNLSANPLLSQWVRVREDGSIDVQVGKVELGQGILTALAQVAAEELEIPVDQVRMVPADTERGPDEGVTSGSLSISTSGSALRVACANVRMLFVRAAARRWQVDEGVVVVENGVIRTKCASHATSYAEVAAEVDLEVAPDPTVTIRPADSARVVGSSVPRLDLPDKIRGRPRYISDMRLPGLMFGGIVRPTTRGACLEQVDEESLTGLPVHIVRDGSFLGVVGEDEATVMAAVERLRSACRWKEAALLPDEDNLAAFLRSGPHETIPLEDDQLPESTPAARRLRASYSRPFLAHASIAPSCAVAQWGDGDEVTVWSHTQGIFRLRAAIADALGLAAGSVIVRHVENAGCYGHNAADDAAFDAVLLARSVPGRPVQVLWSRRDELTWAPFGSAMVADVEATVSPDGRVTTWSYDVWSQGHTSRPGYAGVPGLLAATHLAEPQSYPAAVDPRQPSGGTTRNARPIYELGSRRIVGHRLLESPIRSSALRSLGAFLNVFAIESFMDELAALVGSDPLDFRLAHLHDARARAVLEHAALAAGWGSPMDEGLGRGIGLARYKGFGAYCAVIAEVEAEHEIRVRRLTIAVDVGRVVNPDGVRNQIEGGATQATSWAVKERVRFDRRQVTSNDWESYPILRFSEAPEIDVEVIDRPEEPSLGAGEAAQGPTAGAIGNAVAAAVGVRVRDLPLTPEAMVAAIERDDA